jgi:hypothetical protein
MTRPWIVGWVALLPLLLGAGPPVVESAVPTAKWLGKRSFTGRDSYV